MKKTNHNCTERHYSPKSQRGWGREAWKEMFSEIIRSRELIWRLFLRDLTARYKQSLLGFFWLLVPPLMMVGTFVFINRAGILNVGKMSVPYPVYVLIGTALWQVFTGSLIKCTNSIVAGGGIVVKINFPKEALLLSAVGQAIVDFFVQVILVIIVICIFKVYPKWTVFLVPFSVLPLIILALGLGFFLSVLNAVYRDVGNLISVFTTFLMFFTPVAYPIPSNSLMEKVVAYNPLVPLITASRDLFSVGHFSDFSGFAWSTTLSLLVFFVGWKVFHLTEPRMAERI